MRSFVAKWFRLPEFSGLCFGAGILATWTLLPLFLHTPAWGLFALMMVGVMTGFTIGALAGRQGERSDLAGRRGAKAAAWAVLVASACLVLMARALPAASAPLRALFICGASVLPAMFAGSIAAVIGMMVFRRNAGMDANPVSDDQPAEHASWIRWTGRSFIVLLLMTAAAAPFFPTPHRVLAVDSPKKHPKFHYTMPEALKAASPVLWVLQTSRPLGQFDESIRICLSKDERFIAGVSGQEIVIQELHHGNEHRIQNLPFRPLTIAFSPNAERLFLVSDQPSRIAVVDISTGRFLLPQPKNRTVPDGAVWWRKDKEVWFASEGLQVLSLNLDTLLIEPLDISQIGIEAFKAAVRPSLPKNERWRFLFKNMIASAELPETMGTPDWNLKAADYLALKDSSRAVTRIFPAIPIHEGDEAFGISDGSTILLSQRGALTAYYFTDRQPPPLRFKLIMPHGVEEMTGKAKAARALARGDLGLVMYRPMVNPLNGTTVGPERGQQPKALLRFARWEGNEAEVWVTADFEPYAPGDVLADIHASVSSRDLLSCKGIHRWWIPCPEPMTDASEMSKLPQWTDLEKQRRDAVIAEQKPIKAAPDAKEKDLVRVPPEPEEHETGPTQTGIGKFDDEVTSFVLAHHAKVTEGKVAELVNDYADWVDHFNNGVVSRGFILKDETDYHKKYGFIHERVLLNSVVVQPGSSPPLQVSYTMENDWQKRDGTRGSGVFSVDLVVDKLDGQWRITKHQAEKTK